MANVGLVNSDSEADLTLLGGRKVDLLNLETSAADVDEQKVILTTGQQFRTCATRGHVEDTVTLFLLKSVFVPRKNTDHLVFLEQVVQVGAGGGMITIARGEMRPNGLVHQHHHVFRCLGPHELLG